MAILIVEDEYNDYLFAKIILTIAGIEHIWAVNGTEAIEICKNNKNINLVLMDIKLPGMDGLETTERIKTYRKDLPIIALTVYTMDINKEAATSIGCDDYLAKPYKIDDLLKLIEIWDKIDIIYHM